MKKSFKTYYNHKQVVDEKTNGYNYSKSPMKPKLLIEKLDKLRPDLLNVVSGFQPFKKELFYKVHRKEYVDGFFRGDKNYNTNGLSWSEEFAESVKYTNASLYNAILWSLSSPEKIHFSPTSGFHHARPEGGMGFCTFSGQALASLLVYEQYGKSGCYLDLDGHYGNSIEDTRDFAPMLNKAVPRGFNINPYGRGKDYLDSLAHSLLKLGEAIKQNKIHYIVWCHGADSHEDDDMGGKLSTSEWQHCSEMFYTWLRELEQELGRCIPLSLSLFGGYRKDNYDFVLSLHMSDLLIAEKILIGKTPL